MHLCDLPPLFGPRIMRVRRRSAALPNPDLPEDIKRDFEEARTVLALSPRSAIALLRLVIQKLCLHFGLPADNLNDDIAKLAVQQKIGIDVLNALDIVRVFGTYSLHPKEGLDLRADYERA